MAEEWTLEELVARAARAIAMSGVPVPNGRVTAVPDARVIRWYTTVGLLDRPLARGRQARYGPRHLLQLLAIKQLQARGRSLAEIQAELAGATDVALRAVAGPLAPLAPAEAGPAEPPPGVPAPEVAQAGSAAAGLGQRRERFWRDNPARPGTGAKLVPDTSVPPAPAPAEAGLLYGVALPGGAVLLLPAPPSRDDQAAIQLAALPLARLLGERGLLPADRVTAPAIEPAASTSAEPTEGEPR